MTEIASFEAKTHFSDLLRRVTREGEKFIVTVRGKPVATLGPIDKAPVSSEALSSLLDELKTFRARVSKRGAVLKAGETWKDFAREGLE